jgi:hypothetical protein
MMAPRTTHTRNTSQCVIILASALKYDFMLLNIYQARYQVLTAVSMQMADHRVAALCSLEQVY